VLADQVFDISNRHILVQLDGQCLAVATHRTDTHANAVHRNRVLEATQDLVGFSLRLPFFAALTVWQLFIDPRDQAASQWHAEVLGRVRIAAHGLRNTTVNVEDGAGRISQLICDRSMGRAHLLDQLTHVLRAGARGRLVGHGTHPFHQTRFEQAAQAHQHQADGAVAADVVLGARIQLLVDHLTVDRVQNNDRVILHPQARSRIDPVTLPTRLTQLGEHLGGVVAALAGQNHIEGFQLFNVVSILERGNLFAHGRTLSTDIGGSKKHGLNKIEILLFQHPLHEYGTNHTAPTDQTYTLHHNDTFNKKWGRYFHQQEVTGQRDYRFCSAATTASPISCVPTLVQPADQMSPVRKP